MKPEQHYENCFVTVGTTRFDLLCEYITSGPVLETLKKMGCKNITFQIGNSDRKPGQFEMEGININMYRFKNTIENDIRNADFVISHAGAGSCLEVLDAKKPLLVVINEDLMDNHQLELAEQLQIDGHLFYCTCDTLKDTLEGIDFTMLVPFPDSNPQPFFKALDNMLQIKDKSH
ncbi:UDP-N-acetylglucosamine transferase subunit ALG13 homolog [Leptidea sinapis]|uniref:UDP-N-acetylglucosamine transferase subunit ALG13 n=1 Tax=Leptidea sinapis TaxID=189913 RepID=A0A5E4QY91_9NEOP|nr:UDP-N-acetylglucosamine transferase subunit ALG13 homolog [Leptidea sinapis]VVD02997.1 unnamed protein product [Leptidea sinapis]